MGARDQLGIALARGQRSGGGLQTVSVRVVDVRTDGRVNVDWGGALLVGVPCTDAYRGRAAGDVVAMRPGQRPVVLWRVGPDPGGGDEASIRAVVQDEQVVKAVTSGASVPEGEGWQQATTPWVREVPGGVELHMQLASAGRGTGEEPEPPPTVTPAVTLDAAAVGSWRGGAPAEGGTARQGDPDGTGAYRGGWFYGTAIADACAGKSVAGMTVRLARAPGGADTKVPIRMYLHAAESPPTGQLELVEEPQDLLRLSAEAEATVPLPVGWQTALAAGTARGIAVSATSTGDYAALTGGRITITFTT